MLVRSYIGTLKNRSRVRPCDYYDNPTSRSGSAAHELLQLLQQSHMTTASRKLGTCVFDYCMVHFLSIRLSILLKWLHLDTCSPFSADAFSFACQCSAFGCFISDFSTFLQLNILTPYQGVYKQPYKIWRSRCLKIAPDSSGSFGKYLQVSFVVTQLIH